MVAKKNKNNDSNLTQTTKTMKTFTKYIAIIFAAALMMINADAFAAGKTIVVDVNPTGTIIKGVDENGKLIKVINIRARIMKVHQGDLISYDTIKTRNRSANVMTGVLNSGTGK